MALMLTLFRLANYLHPEYRNYNYSNSTLKRLIILVFFFVLKTTVHHFSVSSFCSFFYVFKTVSIILVCHHFSVLAFRTRSAMVVCAVDKLRHTVLFLFLFGGAGTVRWGTAGPFLRSCVSSQVPQK